jgi:hypothetical protein
MSNTTARFTSNDTHTAKAFHTFDIFLSVTAFVMLHAGVSA